jgi:hypothetical protein
LGRLGHLGRLGSLVDSILEHKQNITEIIKIQDRHSKHTPQRSCSLSAQFGVLSAQFAICACSLAGKGRRHVGREAMDVWIGCCHLFSVASFAWILHMDWCSDDAHWIVRRMAEQLLRSMKALRTCASKWLSNLRNSCLLFCKFCYMCCAEGQKSDAKFGVLPQHVERDGMRRRGPFMRVATWCPIRKWIHILQLRFDFPVPTTRHRCPHLSEVQNDVGVLRRIHSMRMRWRGSSLWCKRPAANKME